VGGEKCELVWGAPQRVIRWGGIDGVCRSTCGRTAGGCSRGCPPPASVVAAASSPSSLSFTCQASRPERSRSRSRALAPPPPPRGAASMSPWCGEEVWGRGVGRRGLVNSEPLFLPHTAPTLRSHMCGHVTYGINLGGPSLPQLLSAPATWRQRCCSFRPWSSRTRRCADGAPDAPTSGRCAAASWTAPRRRGRTWAGEERVRTRGCGRGGVDEGVWTNPSEVQLVGQH
jgi:hypothetical protein